MLGKYLEKVRTSGLRAVALRAAGVTTGRICEFHARLRARRLGTYRHELDIDAGGFPKHYATAGIGAIPEAEQETLRALVSEFRRHRFDLIGSGWIEIREGMAAEGVRGVRLSGGTAGHHAEEESIQRANNKEVERIRSLIRVPDYQPIHWHIAYRSGYEWHPGSWCRDARRRLPRGGDIKEPWELSRMQHLPLMALHATLNEAEAAEMVFEIEAQILDFISANPPSIGVNWACAMDVALRVCSWLICFDLCRSVGGGFSDGFLKVFGRSVFEHAEFISGHLEWSDISRGNHYLFDLVGLIFCCAYLPRTEQTEKWSSFANRELLAEFGRQFNEDGSFFECSTAYHCFVAETLVHAVSLMVSDLRVRGARSATVAEENLVGFLAKRAGKATASRRCFKLDDRIAQDGLDPAISETFSAMARFIDDVTRPDGTIVAIGDNDSGLFTRLGNRYLRSGDHGAPILDDLSRGHVRDLLMDFLYGSSTTWVSALLPTTFQEQEPDQPEWAGATTRRCVVDRVCRYHRELSLGRNASGMGWMGSYYPEFGLWVMRNAGVHVVVRTKAAANQVRLHAHCDELSVAVSMGESNLIEDPGMPFYFSFPELAARYRSRAVHFGPIGIDVEDLVEMELYCDDEGVVIRAHSKTMLAVWREVDRIVIASDWALPELDGEGFLGVPVSRGYGKIDD